MQVSLGSHQPPPWCAGLLPLSLSAIRSLYPSPLHISYLSNTSLHFFLHLFPRPQKLPPLWTITWVTSCCLLLVHLLVKCEPSGFIQSHSKPLVNWGPLFHFLPASRITQNFQLANYFACQSCGIFPSLFNPEQRNHMFFRNISCISTNYRR